MVSGVLVIDKPQGWTSFQVVARVRRLAGEKRVGHAGTLDPLATGVLPVCLGTATRLVEYLSDATKEYRARVYLGATSVTYDAEGPIQQTVPVDQLPAQATVAGTLARFRGPQQQLPPMHSAVQQGGKRLYDLARQGIEVERQPRNVTIYRLDLLDYTPPVLELLVECSKGTYIRSLAHDLGGALGCGAYLAGLVRTRHGPFRLTDACTMAYLEALVGEHRLAEALRPADMLLAAWPRVDLDAEAARRVGQGQPLAYPAPTSTSDSDSATRLRAYGPDGAFLAVVEWDAAKHRWQPTKVFATE